MWCKTTQTLYTICGWLWVVDINTIQYSLFAAKQKRELQKKKKEGRNLHFLLLPSELRAVSYIKNSDGVVFTKLKWTRTVCIDTTERG